MRVLITGGLGFVGGRLGHFLSESGIEVILGTRKKNIKSPEWLPQSLVIQTEWDDHSTLEKTCRGVDVVVHASGMNSSDCKADPVGALRVNGLYTANLLHSAIYSGVKKFIYISTGHVYNNHLQGELTGKISTFNLHPYASSHSAGENVARYAHQQKLIEGVVIRLSNGYGYPMHNGVNCWMLLVNDLCRQAVQTGRMALHSNGVQQRDFIPMSSVVVAIHGQIIRDRKIHGDELYNVVSGQSKSVWEMACLVQHRCEKILDREVPLSRLASFKDGVNLNPVFQEVKNNCNNNEIDHIKEIDCLVDYCIKHFSNTK
jgi:UDP-glucose 4-epimerase